MFLGIGLGIVEDLIAVWWATGEPITAKIIFLITLVTIPFAFLGEVVVDRLNIPYLGKKTELFLEFFAYGIVLGVVEDLLAILISTGEPINMRVVVIAIAVAIPFAVFSELVVDRFNTA